MDRPVLGVGGVAAGVTAVGAAIIAFSRLDTDWNPIDDGILAATADLVSDGLVPHADFVDPYTGGLSAFNALWLAIAGNDLYSLRLPLFAGFVLVALMAYDLARLWVSQSSAFLIAVTSFLVPLLSHHIPMPTWYTTILTLGAVWLVIRRPFARFGATNEFAAGLIMGAAAGVKVTAVYAAAAILAWMLGVSRVRWSPVAVGVLAAPALLVPVLRPSISTILYFTAPVLVSIGLMYSGSPAADVAAALKGALAFMAGAVIIPASFLVWAASTGQLGVVVQRWLLDPLLIRTTIVDQDAPDVRLAVVSLILVIGWTLLRLRLEELRRPLALLAAAMGVLTVFRADVVYIMLVLFFGFLILGSGGALLVMRRSADNSGSLLVMVAAFATLVGFPQYNLVYTLYVLPLVLVALAPIARVAAIPSSLVVWAVFSVLLLTIILALTDRLENGVPTAAPIERIALSTERGGLAVASRYEPWIAALDFIELHSGSGGFWAGPEMPELYFLTDTRHPFGQTYEFLDPQPYGAALPAALDSAGICAIVLNRPIVSPVLDEQTMTEIRELFPFEEPVTSLELRWREDAGC